MKNCTKCGEAKPPDGFSISHKRRRNSWCKACCAAARREGYRKDPERYKAATMRSQKKNAGKTRSRLLNWNYGIDASQYAQMFNMQGGKCAICNLIKTDSVQTLAVDHSHLTGKIRGLLCHRCNTALGLFQDRVDLLLRAKRYLETDSNARYPGLALGRARLRKGKAVQQG
jgi:hypothetical protein